MNTLEKDLNQLQDSGSKAAAESRDRVVLDRMPGDSEPQGDVNLLWLKRLPKGAKPRASRQVAEGNTKGSRHVLLGSTPLYDVEPDAWRSCADEVCEGLDIRDYMVGPVFEVADGETATLDHPEHTVFEIKGPAVVGVCFQRTVAADGQEMRALD